MVVCRRGLGAGKRRTTPARMGSVATTAPEKIKLMSTFGLFGSARKTWWISGSLPYRRGFSVTGKGVFGSVVGVSVKAAEE